MNFADTAADWLLRVTRRSAWLEHLLAIAGWLIAPVSVVTLGLTGELMAYGWRLEGLPHFATLRAMHVLAGGALIAVVLHHAARWAWRAHRRGIDWLALRAWAPRWRDSGPVLIRAGAWLALLLLLATGLARHARLRYGWSPLAPGSPAAWDVLHVALVPYFYTFLLLEAYILVRRWYPALRDYLVRQY